MARGSGGEDAKRFTSVCGIFQVDLGEPISCCEPMIESMEAVTFTHLGTHHPRATGDIPTRKSPENPLMNIWIKDAKE